MTGLIIVIINFVIFRKYIYSIFDPFVLGLFSSSLAYSVVFILYFLNLISDYYFFSFIATQTAFFIGFLLVKPIDIKKVIRKSRVTKLEYSLTAKYLYFISVILYVSSQLFVYYKVGIPLLMRSQLDTFVGGSGFGMFNRILTVTSIVVTSITIYRIFFINKKSSMYNFLNYLILSFIIVVAILSGSKSSVLSLVFIIFFVILFNYKVNNKQNKEIIKKMRKLQWKFFFIAIAAAIFIIFIQAFVAYGSDNSINPLISLVMRFVDTGDVYMYSYPNNFLAGMTHANPFIALFKDFLGMFRILRWNEMPQHLGQQLYQTMFHTDAIKGPNARHNVFGLFYFGPVWSIYFSLILGIVVSFLRNKLYFLVPSTVMGMVIYILLAKFALGLEADPPYTLSNYNSIFVVFSIIYLVSFVLSNIQLKRSLKYE